MIYRCLQPDGHTFEAGSPENAQRVGLLPLCPTCATVGLPEEEPAEVGRLETVAEAS